MVYINTGAILRAVRLEDYGKNVVVREVPEPAVERNDDVVVKVQAAGVCRTDLHIIGGMMKEATGNPGLPFTLGHENVGTVHARGSGVSGLELGDQVILHPQISCGICLTCRNGDDMHCVHSRSPGLDGTDGGFAEYVKASERSVVKLKKGTDPVEVAPLADAGVTVYHAVRKILPYARPDSYIAVIGLGALGQIAVQLLKNMTNSNIIGIDKSEQKLGMAEKLGANWVFPSGDDGGVKEALKVTGAKGADIVMDFVGENNTPASALSMIGRGGIYSVVGYGGEINLKTLQLVGMELSVLGNLVGTYRDLVDLMSLYYQGKVKIETRTFSLDDASTALSELSRGEIRGRAVLLP